MNSRYKASIVLALVPLAACLTAKYAFGDEPPQSLIREYVEDQLPPYYDIVHFETLVLPSADAGAGRVSAEVLVELSEDMFDVEGFGAVNLALQQQGFGGEEPEFFVDRNISASEQRIFRLGLRSGEVFQFFPELIYTQTIRGFQFSGNLGFPRISGIPRSELPIGSHCIGDSECDAAFQSLIDTLIADREAHFDTIENIRSRGRSTFNGVVFVAADPRIDPTNNNWSSETPFVETLFVSVPIDLEHHYYNNENPGQYQLWGESEILWAADGNWNSVQYRAGEISIMRIVLLYSNIEPGMDGMPTLELLTGVSRPGQPGQWIFRGGDFPWNGSHFVRDTRVNSSVRVVPFFDADDLSRLERVLGHLPTPSSEAELALRSNLDELVIDFYESQQETRGFGTFREPAFVIDEITGVEILELSDDVSRVLVEYRWTEGSFGTGDGQRVREFTFERNATGDWVVIGMDGRVPAECVAELGSWQPEERCMDETPTRLRSVGPEEIDVTGPEFYSLTHLINGNTIVVSNYYNALAHYNQLCVHPDIGRWDVNAVGMEMSTRYIISGIHSGTEVHIWTEPVNYRHREQNCASRPHLD